MAVIELDVQDFLPLGQGDVHRPTAHNINQWLPITQVARTQRIDRTIQHLYSPAQVVSVRRSVVNKSIIDYFIMYHQGAKNAATESLISIFFMWQEARLVEFEQISQTLTFLQVVLVTSAKAAFSTFAMTHEATLIAIRGRSVANTLTMVSRATGYPLTKYTPLQTIPTPTGPNAPEC